MALCAVVGWTAACGGSPQPGPAPPAAKPAPKEEAGPPAGQVDRQTLDLVLLEGPVWLLERVPIEEVMEQGKFVGWRVQQLPSQWADVDLQPGDVITAVNGQAVEKPNDFWAAWTTLSTAKEIKIAYRRYGEPNELTVPIWGDPDPQTSQRLKGKRPPPQQSQTISPGSDTATGPAGIPPASTGQKPKHKPTIVISPPAPPPGNDY
ncbi:MAG: serine protease [Deltaproteobacteria bacterium]|nr:serine protease [Deltaproteobacteria bacterium]